MVSWFSTVLTETLWIPMASNFKSSEVTRRLFLNLRGSECWTCNKMWKSPLSVLSCAAVCFTSAVSQAHIVDVGYAKYKGNQTYPNAIAYLGIPYAEPPVGDLRFRAPQSLNTTRVAGFSTFVTDATQYPDFCIQGTTGG